MKMTEEQIVALAKAAQIALTDQEVCAFTADLSALHDLADALLAYPLQSQDRVPAALTEASPLREDLVQTCLPRDLLLRAAPVCRDGYLVVPRAVED